MAGDYDDSNDIDADLTEIAEQIQVGDTQEGAQALKRLMTKTAGNRRSVRDELADMALQAETDEAIGAFKRKYPKIADDPILADAARSALREQVIEDLKAAGLSDEHIAPARNDLNRLAAVHTHARRQGLNVRKASDLLDATGDTMSRKFNIPKASRSHAEVVAGMRAERGFKAEADGSSGIVDQDVRSRSAPPPTYGAPRRINPTSAEAGRADRTRAYIADRRAYWNKARGMPSD